MVYRCKKELEGKTLCLDDKVIFKIKEEEFEYKVHPSHLRWCNSVCNNDIIFKKLKIDDKYKFCSEWYGYDSSAGIFPTCRINDYETLTIVTLALFEKCEPQVNSGKSYFVYIGDTNDEHSRNYIYCSFYPDSLYRCATEDEIALYNLVDEPVSCEYAHLLPGREVRIKDTENVRYYNKEAIGETFIISDNLKTLGKGTLKSVYRNTYTTSAFTEKNEYAVNFYVSDLELVTNNQINNNLNLKKDEQQKSNKEFNLLRIKTTICSGIRARGCVFSSRRSQATASSGHPFYSPSIIKG